MVIHVFRFQKFISVKDKPIELHGFADDHSYKKSFAKSRVEEINMMRDLESCAERIKNWMDGNRIKDER